MSRAGNLQFDWYKVSLLNKQNPNIQQFEQILRHGNIAKNIQTVPTRYRQNILQLFQTVSGKLKKKNFVMNQNLQRLSWKKTNLVQNIQEMQQQLQQSKSNLVHLKTSLNQKKKMTKKLKQKITNMKKAKRENQSKQTYYCPFCTRSDFQNRQAFTQHVQKQHNMAMTNKTNVNLMHNNSQSSSSEHNQLKEFIMTLKDKEMEMMKMILSQKKELQTQQLQKLYEKQLKLHTMKNSSSPAYLVRNGQNQQLDGQIFNQQIGVQEGQLKGDSQFLFYKKSQQYKRAAERQEQEYSLKKAIEAQRVKKRNLDPYYDFFSHVEENKSQQYQQERPERQKQYVSNNTALKPSNSDYKHSNIQSEKLQEQRFPVQAGHSQNSGGSSGFKVLNEFSYRPKNDLYQINNTLITNTQVMQNTLRQNKAIQPLRLQPNQTISEEFSPSITDRLKIVQMQGNSNQEVNQQKNKNYSSFYKESNSSKYIRSSNKIHHKTNNNYQEPTNYVFNSGPILNDLRNNAQSDEEDYFSRQMQTVKFQNQRSKFMQQSKQQQNETSLIQDQEIRLDPTSFVSHSLISQNNLVNSFSNSKQRISQLLSPQKQQTPFKRKQTGDNQNRQNTSGLNTSKHHDKSSQIVDLSNDSFSRRDFELSRDDQDETINLSDLKFSKLEKRKAQERQKMLERKQAQQRQNNMKRANKIQAQQIQSNNADKPEFFVVKNHEKTNTQQEQQKINLLTDFAKKQFPLFQKISSLEKNPSYTMAMQIYQSKEKTNQSNSKLKYQFQYGEFYKKTAQKGYPQSEMNSYLNDEPTINNKAISPQEFFKSQKHYLHDFANKLKTSQNRVDSKIGEFIKENSKHTRNMKSIDQERSQVSSSSINHLSNSRKSQSSLNKKKLSQTQKGFKVIQKAQPSEKVLQQFFKKQYQEQPFDQAQQQQKQKSSSQNFLQQFIH